MSPESVYLVLSGDDPEYWGYYIVHGDVVAYTSKERAEAAANTGDSICEIRIAPPSGNENPPCPPASV